MKLTVMKMTTVIGALAMLLGAGASSAQTIAPGAAVPPDPAPTDTFDVTISGSAFADGTSGGGLTVTWDAPLLDLISVTPVFPLCDPVFNPCGTGVLDQAGGSLSDMDFLSIAAGTAATDFDIVVLTFLAQAGGTATITPSLGNFPSTTTPNVWVDEGGIFDVNPTFTAGTVTIVPVPAAVWLLGSGLLGLVGVARRRRLSA